MQVAQIKDPQLHVETKTLIVTHIIFIRYSNRTA